MNREDYIHVPYGKSVHGQEEIDAVVNVLKTSTQMGKHVREMEMRVAALFDKPYGVMLNSGSSANYLAFELLNFPEGSEIITPVLTFSTTVAPIIKNKLVPVFIDVSPTTFVIDESKIEAQITDKTKAMMIPNLLGNCPNWPYLRELADQYNLILIDDSCDTLGATINGESVGHYADISITSFYGSHIINCAGNGGMLCVRDQVLYERAKLLRSWGRSSSLFVESEAIENRFDIKLDDIQYDRKFIFETPGYNLEPSEMGAAFGLVQLDKLELNHKLRDKAFQAQDEFFNQYQHWFMLPSQRNDLATAWLAYPLIVKPEAPFTRTELQVFFEQHNIQTRTIFTGNILRQPGFKHINHRAAEATFSNADRVTAGGMLLGCHQGMTDEMLTHVHNTFIKFAEQYQ